MKHWRFVLAITALLAACATPPPQPPTVQLRILAINDYHGNLKPSPGGIRIDDPANPGQRITVATGGAAQMAALLTELRKGQAHTIFVAAGDLVGATPLLSSIFNDEPTIDVMGLMGLELSALGNHELDKGPAEALRRQAGGCHPVAGCKGPAPYAGAKFQYLAANTTVTATGKTLFPPYVIKRYDGIPVAFVGLALKNTPSVVVASGVAGLAFGDEADAINRLVPELRAQGVEAIVAVMHEGGLPSGGYNDCPGITGRVVDVVQRMDKAVDVVVSGHTHTAYNCVIDGRVVTSADRYGTLVTAIDITLSRATRDVVAAKANNVIVREGAFAPDTRVAALLAAYEERMGPLARRTVTRLAAPFSVRIADNGASELGQLVADAQLAATRNLGAQIALMNQGGVRAPLGGEGKLDIGYEDVFAVQPFANQLVTMTFTGTQLRQLLEAQALDAKRRILYVSRGLSYTWDAAQPEGQRIVADSLRLDGQPVLPDQRLRITVNAFVAGGGDAHSVFRQGQDVQTGPVDVDAFEQYLLANPGLAPDPVPRVRRLN